MRRMPAGPRRLAVCLLAIAVLVAAAVPAGAKILKTRTTSEGPAGQELRLNVGSGFEFETDSEESEYGFPFLAEYGFTENFKLSVEPNYVLIHKKQGGSINGPGDLETTLLYEFPTERRYRPGLALQGTVKWPTARRGELGTGQTDYSIGAIVGKEFVPFDLDLNAIYTFVGDPPGVQLKDTFEASLAAEWHLTEAVDVETEAVTSFGAAGRFGGRPGSLGSFANIGGPEQGQSEWETTVGVAEHLNEFLKVEQGVVYKSSGSWQIVFAWEWDFGGGR